MILEMTATAVLSLSALPTRASSETANYLDDQIDRGRCHLLSSYSLGRGMTTAVEDLLRVWKECCDENWDAHGAAPIAKETHFQARAFLNTLPLGIPAPSVGAEPDGHLTLEWYQSPRRTLSVSISPEGDLHYAALLGPSKAYGTEPFLGEVPQRILSLIHRVAPHTTSGGALVAA